MHGCYNLFSTIPKLILEIWVSMHWQPSEAAEKKHGKMCSLPSEMHTPKIQKDAPNIYEDVLTALLGTAQNMS